MIPENIEIHIADPFIDPANSAVVETILLTLPDWFGIEEAILHYRDSAASLPTLIAQVSGSPVGCLAVLQHSPYAAEIFVMGVLPEFHRCGVGRRMVRRVEDWLRVAGVEYLQVKTLAASHPDPHYARTRVFYETIGFRPLEVFPTLWDENNPCLMMIKKL